jgi:dipeptidase E
MNSSEGKIYIAGGGNEHDSQLVDQHFAKNLPKNARILYLPFAALPKGNGYTDSITWLTETLQNADPNHIFEITTPTIDDIDDQQLSSYDAVYMGGGNSFRLRELIRQSGLAENLKNYYLSGGTIYGGSAGAIILGKTLKTVPAENIIGSTNFDGLDLLGGLAVVCHFTPERALAVQQLASSENIALLALSEKAGCLYQAGTCIDLGSEPARHIKP